MRIFVTILAGCLVGFLIGLTGMGGGAVMTPFLILVLKIDPVTAVGTDLAFAALTKWMGGIQHRRSKNVSLRMVIWLALGSIPASLLTSSWVVSRANSNGLVDLVLPKILGLVLVLVAIYTLARALNWIKSDQELDLPPRWALTLIGVVGGGLVGLTSVGSGTIIMAALLIFFSVPANKLVGLDVLHGALLTTTPALVYAFHGQVNWNLWGWLLLGSLPGVWLGVRMIKVLPQKAVRGTLSFLLLFAGAKLIF